MFQWTESDRSTTKRIKRAAIALTLAAVFLCCLGEAGRADPGSVWMPLIDRLTNDGFDRNYIESVFNQSGPKFSPEIMARKMNVLLRTKLRVKKTGSRGTPEVMDRYLNPILLAGAYAFYREHSGHFVSIEDRYGVPGEVLTALMLVETKLGTQVGQYNGITILSNMAIAKDFELIRSHIKSDGVSDSMMDWLVRRTEQKANWGYGELKSLLTYAKKNGHDPRGIPSSMYGAIGLCQFIPSSAIHYGVDGSGDGVVDLFEMVDALYSMANFVKQNGWKPGMDREAQLKVVYRYNHSESYALTIMAVADKLKKTSDFFGN